MIDVELPLWLELIGFVVNTVLAAALLIQLFRLYEIELREAMKR